MTSNTNGGIKRSEKLKHVEEMSLNWVVIVGGAMLSTLSIRFCCKLKQAFEVKRSTKTQISSKENGKSTPNKRHGSCKLHSESHQFTRHEDGCHQCVTEMGSKMVETALNNSSRETLIQITDDMKGFKPDYLGCILEAQVKSGEAFRCCAHSWTPTHDKLLLKGHQYFLRTHHDGSKKFLLPSGWKRVQGKFKLMDQHIVGLGDLQKRFYAIQRGEVEPPKILLYRLWSEKEVTVLRSLHTEIMSVARPLSKKIFLDPPDFMDIQQSLWYYLDCCPEMESVENKLLEMVQKK